MAPTKVSVMSEYERKRQQKIAENAAKLKELGGIARKVGIAPAAPKKKVIKSEPRAPRVREAPEASRRSLRLQQVDPENVVEKRKIEEVMQKHLDEERLRKKRKTGDLEVKSLLGSDNWDAFGNFLKGVAPKQPNIRSFDPEDAKKTTEKDVKKAIEAFSSLSLWEDVHPNKLKITPERAYTLAFHPTDQKALVFAGDKYGTLGIFDSGSSTYIKPEDEDEEGDLKLSLTQLKLHTKSITAIKILDNEPNSIYTSSYDSSIRRLDLARQVAVEVFAPEDDDDEEGISCIDLVNSEPHMMYFTTLDGRFGSHDTRTGTRIGSGTNIYSLTDKKIGGFSLDPLNPHFFATASLDRTLALWDLRSVKGKGDDRVPLQIGEHASRLSVSHASWNSAGQVVTSSYDDTIKIYDFSSARSLKAGSTLDDSIMDPTTTIRHNNQCGRWVTILKPHWQERPADGLNKFCMGSMDRFVDIYDHKGTQLAQLGGSMVTAVPAVCQIHPSREWVAGANNSGKLCLWL